MKETTALATVPVDIPKIEGIPVDSKRKITVDEKRRLLDILRSKFDEIGRMLNFKKAEVREAILKDARERAGLGKFMAEAKLVNEAIEKNAAEGQRLREKHSAIYDKAQMETGFDIEGNLMNDRERNYGDVRERALFKARYAKGLAKRDDITAKIELAESQVDRFGLKFDKIETRLLLATTVGEVSQIMSAVLGNGDSILGSKPEPTVIEKIED